MGATTNLQNELQRLAEGSPESQRTIIEQTCERLRMMARRMLRKFPGVGRWSETDDVLQAALLRLHRALHVVRPESPRKYYGLAATQIRRELIDLARKFAGPQGLGKHDSDGGVAISEKSDPNSEPATIEDWTSFHEAVEKLPDAEQEVFNLLFYNALNQADAAKVLGVSLATLKRRWLSARLTLRVICEGDLFD